MHGLKKIPYGLTDFERFNTQNYYYVDKTKYIEEIEYSSDYIFLIRPRRFGKSLWLSVLEDYYDIAKQQLFDTYFQNTFIGKNPTTEQGQYLILSFNFSAVNPAIDKVESSFEYHCRITYDFFYKKYRDILGPDFNNDFDKEVQSYEILEYIYQFCSHYNHKLYVIIDEYDNFANTILSTPQNGTEQYKKLTHSEGFFRFFFNKLKAGTSGSGAAINKLFITGVSPLTMDDVTSGFNIGWNISTNETFNGMVGFTRAEVKELLLYYRNEKAILFEPDYLLSIFDEWYSNYVFSSKANFCMYNSDMVLYFVKKVLHKKYLPDSLIDQNAKTDYEKLRHLVLLDNQLNGNFSILKEIFETGSVLSDLKEAFSVSDLQKRECFVSLLYYFGLLSIQKETRGKVLLSLPNETIKSFFTDYILKSYEESNIFKPDIYHYSRLLDNMAYEGAWKPVFKFLSTEVEKQTRIRDYIRGESMIKGFIMTNLNIGSHYIVHPEYEMNKGFADLYLEPFFVRHQEIKYCYVIEIKYEKRREKGISTERFNSIKSKAKDQLLHYLKDNYVTKTKGETFLKGIMLIYNGWELVYYEDV